MCFLLDLDYERLAAYDEIQRGFSADGIFGGKFCMAGVRRLRYKRNLMKDFSLLLTHPDKKQTIKGVEKFIEYYNDIKAKTPYQLHDEGIDIQADIHKIVKGNAFLSREIPPVRQLNRMNYRSKFGFEGVITVLGLLRYKEKEGEYPESLETLVNAGFLKGLPLDPFSDGQLIYRRAGNDFVLYSIGGNYIDDGGVRGTNSRGKAIMWSDDEGDHIFWPVFKEE